jgi:hypothetical protein
MTTDSEQPDQEAPQGEPSQPNASPDLQDAIRSIDAIGENAWGKDDDEDAPRVDRGASEPEQQETTDGNPDAP